MFFPIRRPKFYLELFHKLFRNIVVHCTQSQEPRKTDKISPFAQQTPFKNVLVLRSALNLVSELQQLLFKIIIPVYLMFFKNVSNNLQYSHFFTLKRHTFYTLTVHYLYIVISNLNDLSSTTLNTSVAKTDQ